MPAQATPNTGAMQEAPSIEARMEAYLSQSSDQGSEADPPEKPEDTNPPQGNAEQPEGQADELSPDDLEVEAQTQEQPAVDAFEIVHNGQQIKLSREETIKYAQQGLDATRKWDAAAEKDRQATQKWQQLSEIDHVRPYLQQQEGLVTALGMQLRQYQNVDWVAVANEDPVGYAPKRAQYDVLVNNYQQALGQYNQVRGEVNQRLEAVRAQQLAQEFHRLPDLVPEWKDKTRFQADQGAITKYLEGQGIPFEEANRKLDNAFALATVYKAMKYDQLLKAKGEKVKQLRTAPPVTKPGAAQSGTATADKDIQLRTNLKKTGSREDAVAVYLNRMK